MNGRRQTLKRRRQWERKAVKCDGNQDKKDVDEINNNNTSDDDIPEKGEGLKEKEDKKEWERKKFLGKKV